MLCEIAERTFREIRGGHDVNFLDTQFLEFPDLINYLLRRTDQARRPDRVRSHEAPLLLLQESRMAVMYLPESRVLRKAEALDPLYRVGRVISASEIRDMKEVGDGRFIRRAGMVVRYGHRILRLGAKQFYIPSRTPDYAQIKEQLVSIQHRSA